MSDPREDLLLGYVLAKDGNRPHLLRQVFAASAQLEMVVNTSGISFPARANSRDEIADVLVRQFGAVYENVSTFCMDRPAGALDPFTCDWAVGMTDKASGQIRVGCGRYDWRFSDATPVRATYLRITIAAMVALPPLHAEAILDWLAALPYPWCDAGRFIEAAPPFEELAPVIAHLRQTETP